MTSRRKRLLKLLNHHSEISFQEIKTVLNDIGYQLIRISGSHHVFRGIFGDTINLPVHNGKINKYYLKDIKNIISKYINYYEKM